MNKNTKKLLIAIVLIIFFILTFYFFNRQTTAPVSNINYTFEMQGASETGKLGIQSKELNSQVLLQGVLCVSHPDEISKVDLYMPDMGHGSSPPVITRALEPIPGFADVVQSADFGCFNISKMEMFMPGLWQVRVFYQNGEQGYFDINLED